MVFWGLRFLECGEVTHWFNSPAEAEAARRDVLAGEPTWADHIEMIAVDFNPSPRVVRL